jgi:hypothetical protein
VVAAASAVAVAASAVVVAVASAARANTARYSSWMTSRRLPPYKPEESRTLDKKNIMGLDASSRWAYHNGK